MSSTTATVSSSSSSSLQQPHSHIFQHQSSVLSCGSVQTVLLQNHLQSSTTSINSSSIFMSANYSNSSSTYSASNNNNNIINCTFNGGCLVVPAGGGQSYICNSAHCEDALNIADVADLLHPQYAIISGGRSSEGCPLITFPDHNNFQSLFDPDYQKLVTYLTSVPS